MSMAVPVLLLGSVQYVLPSLLCLGHTDMYMCMCTFICSQLQTSTALIYGHHLETEQSPPGLQTALRRWVWRSLPATAAGQRAGNSDAGDDFKAWVSALWEWLFLRYPDADGVAL